jgi:hypothetical protein
MIESRSKLIAKTAVKNLSDKFEPSYWVMWHQKAVKAIICLKSAFLKVCLISFFWQTLGENVSLNPLLGHRGRDQDLEPDMKRPASQISCKGLGHGSLACRSEIVKKSSRQCINLWPMLRSLLLVI